MKGGVALLLDVSIHRVGAERRANSDTQGQGTIASTREGIRTETQGAPEAVIIMLPPASSLLFSVPVISIAGAAYLIARKHDVVFTCIILSHSTTV